MALVEDSLLLRVGFRDQVLRIISVPEQLGALESPKEFGFGYERRPSYCGVGVATGD